MSKFKLNNKGQSLVSVMVAVGILATVTLAVLSLTDNMNKSERSFRLKNDALEFRNFVLTQFSAPNVCKANFLGQTATAGSSINLTNLFGVNASGALDSGKLIASSAAGSNTVSPGLNLASMQVANVSLVSPNTFKGTLKLNFSGRDLSGGSDFTREFGIIFVSNAANAIQDCTVSGGVMPASVGGSSGGNCPARTHVLSGGNVNGAPVYQDLPMGFPTQSVSIPAGTNGRGLGSTGIGCNGGTFTSLAGYVCENGVWQDVGQTTVYTDSCGDDGN